MEDSGGGGTSCSISVDKGLKSKLEVDHGHLINSINHRAIEEDSHYDDDLSEDELLSQMGYVKSEPNNNNNNNNKHVDDKLEEEEEEADDLTEELAAINLVSALKGSRLKEDEPAEELHVSWAPEVYDPPTGYIERLEASESERQKTEPKMKKVGAGKNKQKVGSASKDRKHHLKKHGRYKSRYPEFDND